MLSWLIVAALAKPLSELPAPPPAPIVPKTTRSAYDRAEEEPPATGSSTSLDLAALAHTRTTYTLRADVSAIGNVDRSDIGVVFNHLSADPRWRVTRWDGAIVAFRREPDRGDFGVSRVGTNTSGRTTLRVALRTGEWGVDSAWVESPHVAYWPADTYERKVGAYAPMTAPWLGRSATAITIVGDPLRLDVVEVSTDDDRKATSNAIGDITPYVDGLVADAGLIKTVGYDENLIPRGYPHKGDPTIALSSPGPGRLDVRAWVNPGRPAWCWTRLLDEDLVPWEESAIGVGTLERVGGATDPRLLFYMQGEFGIRAGDRFAGTAEIWCQGDNAAAAERVLTEPVKVPKR